MSLVVAYCGRNFQVWCCDGRTVFSNKESVTPVCDDVCKIHSLNDNKVLCGWAGERYDAETVLRGLADLPLPTRSQVVGRLACRTNHVALQSKAYCAANQEMYCPTGFVIGGFDFEGSFLATVDPEGSIRWLHRIAAMGINADGVAANLAQRITLNAEVEDVLRIVLSIFVEQKKDSALVGGRVSLLVLTPCGLQQIHCCGEPVQFIFQSANEGK